VGRYEFGRATRSPLLGDFDNDGEPGHGVGQRRAGPNALYVNTGRAVRPAGRSSARTDRGIAWADFDLDGDLDLAVGNGILAWPSRTDP